MKKVLITGSGGFIGGHLMKALKAKDVEVVEFSLQKGQDVTDKKDFAALPQVDSVFHLAAVSGYKASSENAFSAYEVNVGGTVNVLEYCKRVKAKIIFPSTYVYDQPYTDYKKETDTTKPRTHYSFTKFLGEELCRFYSRIFKVDSLILRTSNVYGAGQDEIYIVPVIAKHLLSGKSLSLTKPEIERSFIYIDDLVEAYIKLAETKTRPGEVFNVGPDKPTILQELVSSIEKISGKKAKVSYSGKSRPHDADKNRLDISKIKQKINWRPEISLEEGLRRYFKTNQEK